MKTIPVYTHIGDDPYIYGIPLSVAKYFGAIIIVSAIVAGGLFMAGMWIIGLLVLSIVAGTYRMVRYLIATYGVNCVSKWSAYWGETKVYVINRSMKKSN